MCVVLVCPPRVRPSIETLALCEAANPHGGGLAWRRNEKVEWLKTNNLDELHRVALKAKGQIVIHFRIASIGAVCDELRHPFPVTPRAPLGERGQSKAVLFQNGTWPGYREALDFAEQDGHKIPGGPMSDTRAAAFLCSIYGRKFLKKCAPSRWVYFSAAEATLYGQWHKRGGIYYSNLYWQPRDTKPVRPPQNVSNAKPKDNSPGHRTREAMELWDLSGTNRYWEHVSRALPKSQKVAAHE
jgi:hypothetical protein